MRVDRNPTECAGASQITDEFCDFVDHCIRDNPDSDFKSGRIDEITGNLVVKITDDMGKIRLFEVVLREIIR